MIKSSNSKVFLSIIILFQLNNAFAMGLRSFVALPLEQSGTVIRVQDLHTHKEDKNTAILNIAHGVTGTQTILLGMPYRLSPGGSNRSGDISALYRYTAWKKDFFNGSYRFAVLGGGLIPTNPLSNGALQGGGVATFYQERHEVDIDAIWKQGIGKSQNRAQYDVSYQFRLWPDKFTTSDLSSQWSAVIEYNGRWEEDNNLTHQTTIGLQWIHPTWVLEGGIIKDINHPKDSTAIISARVHF